MTNIGPATGSDWSTSMHLSRPSVAEETPGWLLDLVRVLGVLWSRSVEVWRPPLRVELKSDPVPAGLRGGDVVPQTRDDNLAVR